MLIYPKANASVFAGHSLRAGLANCAQVEEAPVQKRLGHASAEMTRRHQRKRDRFRVNLTKAAGLQRATIFRWMTPTWHVPAAAR